LRSSKNAVNAKFGRYPFHAFRCIEARRKKGRSVILRPFPIGVLARPRSVRVVDGFDALALVPEPELLVAALLARLLVLRRAGGRGL
jgi:hypothetical protein